MGRGGVHFSALDFFYNERALLLLLKSSNSNVQHRPRFDPHCSQQEKGILETSREMFLTCLLDDDRISVDLGRRQDGNEVGDPASAATSGEKEVLIMRAWQVLIDRWVWLIGLRFDYTGLCTVVCI